MSLPASTLALLLGLLTTTDQGAQPPQAEGERPGTAPGSAGYVCAPCGARCDRKVLAAPGTCNGCGMETVPRESVFDVVVLLFEDVELLSFAGTLAVFDSSASAMVTVVADTLDPIPCHGSGIAIVPGADLAAAPEPDLLILPSGWGAREAMGDELIVDWVRRGAAAADHVLTVGSGSALLAATGALEGRRATGPAFFADVVREASPKASYEPTEAIVEDGKFWSARGSAEALDIAYVLLERALGAEAAGRSARRLGLPGAEEEER